MRAYEQLDKFDRKIVSAQVKGFFAYVKAINKPKPAPRVGKKGYGALPGMITAYLRKHKQASNKEIAQGLGREFSSVQYATASMTKKRLLIKKQVGDRDVIYLLPENA